jgi:hypothetical protein
MAEFHSNLYEFYRNVRGFTTPINFWSIGS